MLDERQRNELRMRGLSEAQIAQIEAGLLRKSLDAVGLAYKERGQAQPEAATFMEMLLGDAVQPVTSWHELLSGQREPEAPEVGLSWQQILFNERERGVR